MQFAIPAAEQGTCIVLRLWNQGGRESENEQVMQLLEKYVQKPWHERPDGFRLCDNLYLEFDRKFNWPEAQPPSNSPEGEGLLDSIKPSSDVFGSTRGEVPEENRGLAATALTRDDAELLHREMFPFFVIT